MSGTVESSYVASAGGFNVRKSVLTTRGDKPADMYRKALSETTKNINHANELLYNILKKHHAADMDGAYIAPYALQLCIDPSTISLPFDPTIDDSDLTPDQKNNILTSQLELMKLDAVSSANRFYKHPGFLAKSYKGEYKGIYVVGAKDIKHGLSQVSRYLAAIPKAVIEILKLSRARKLTASTFNIVYHMTKGSNLERFINSEQFAYPQITTAERESKERSTKKIKKVVYCTGIEANIQNCLSDQTGRNILSFINEGHGYFSSSVLMNLFSLHSYYMKITGNSIKNTPEKLLSYGAIDHTEQGYVSKIGKKLTSLMGSSHASPLMLDLFAQGGRFTSEKAAGKIDARYFGHSAIQSIVSGDIIKVPMTFRWPVKDGGDGKTHAKLAYTNGGPDAISFCDFVKTFVIRQNIPLDQQLVWVAYLGRIASNSLLYKHIVSLMNEARKSDKLSEKQKNKGMCIVGTEITSINSAASDYLKEQIVSAINGEMASAEASGRVPNTAAVSRDAFLRLTGGWNGDGFYSGALLNSQTVNVGGVTLPGFDENVIFGMLRDKQILSSFCNKINLFKAFEESKETKSISDFKKTFEYFISETLNIANLLINQYSGLVSQSVRTAGNARHEYDTNYVGKQPKEIEELLTKIANGEIYKYIFEYMRDAYIYVKETTINLKRLVSSFDDINDTVKKENIQSLYSKLEGMRNQESVEISLRKDVGGTFLETYNGLRAKSRDLFEEIYMNRLAAVLRELGVAI